LHVTVLSRSARIYSTRRLVQSARMRGAKVRVLDPVRVEMHLGDKPGAWYQHKKLEIGRAHV